MDRIIPRDYQEKSIQRMMAEPTKSILLGSEMDTGKTLMAVEFALRMGFESVLIIGIKDTYDQINQRILAQSDGTRSMRRIDASKAGKQAEADLLWGIPGWYFIGQQLFNRRDWVSAPQFHADGRPKIDDKGKQIKEPVRKGYWDNLSLDLIIYDEVHMAANYKALGRKTIHAVHPEWKLAMSGTFYGNAFDNAWAPSYWLWPDLIDRSYWRWRGQWCEEKEVRIKGGRTAKIVLSEKAPEGTFVKSLPCYIRHVGQDSVPEPKIIEVDLLPEQRRMYDELEENMVVWKNEHPFVVEFPFTLRSRLRTATLAEFDFENTTEDTQEIYFPSDAESTKLDALWPELAQYPTERVILGTDSKKFAKLVVARMQARGMNAVEWSGDVSSKRRQEIKDAWIAGEIQYIVCVIKSFSTGLDWAQTDCWRIGWLSRSDDATVNDQFVRRVFRTGPHKHKFEHFEIQARNTYDTGVYANTALKSYQQKQILRGEAA